MAHENSRTIERDGRYYNVSFAMGPIAAGGVVGAAQTGQVLTPLFPWERWWYPTLEMAVEAAKRRSEAMDRLENVIRRGVREQLAHAFGRAADVFRRHQVSVTAIEREEAAKRAFQQRWGISYEEWLRRQRQSGREERRG